MGLTPTSDMRLLLASAFLVLSACGDGSSESFDHDGGDAETPVATEPTTPPAGSASATDRPATDTRTISIEGMDEAIDVRLVRYDDAPMPFSTYLPADWRDESVSSGEGTAFTFGTGDGAAEMTLFMPSEANRDNVVEIARAVSDGRGGVQEVAPPGPGVEALFAFSSETEAGSITVREHDGTSYYVMEAFPYEYGDGFAPRSNMVLDEIRWLDAR